jgi:hypothetical protein
MKDAFKDSYISLSLPVSGNSTWVVMLCYNFKFSYQLPRRNAILQHRDLRASTLLEERHAWLVHSCSRCVCNNLLKLWPVSSSLCVSCLHYIMLRVEIAQDRHCGLVVRVPGYISRDPMFDSRRYQIFWEVVDLERGSLSLVSITEELFEWKSSGSGSRELRLTAVGFRCADHANLLSAKVGTNFPDKRRSLGRYSSLVD